MHSWMFISSTAKFKVECIKSSFFNHLFAFTLILNGPVVWEMNSGNIPCSFSFTVKWFACIIITKELAKCCLKKNQQDLNFPKVFFVNYLTTAPRQKKLWWERKAGWHNKRKENTTDRQHNKHTAQQVLFNTLCITYNWWSFFSFDWGVWIQMNVISMCVLL